MEGVNHNPILRGLTITMGPSWEPILQVAGVKSLFRMRIGGEGKCSKVRCGVFGIENFSELILITNIRPR